MTADERFVELWNDFLEGEVDAQGMEELQTLIAEQRRLRTAVDSYQLHRLLGLYFGESDQRRSEFVQRTLAQLPADTGNFVDGVMRKLESPSPARHAWAIEWRTSLALVATLLLAVFSGIYVLWPPQEPTIAHITGTSGSLLWTGNGGRVVRNLATGSELSGGTLEGMAPDSWAELEFWDGTTVTLSGRSMLTFSESDQQKELHLREGNIAANVSPQPTNKPLLIHTRSALLEVLGTQFHVEAELSSTMLNVSQGKVRVKRLNDGSVVDVPAHHRVIASADHQLTPVQVPNFVTHWKSELRLGPEDTLGKWLFATDEEPARLKAVPFVFTPPESESLTLYLVALSITQGDSRPVLLDADARFRLRGRMEASHDLYFGITVNHTDGKFAGKFLTWAPAASFPAGREFEVDLPVQNFQLDPSLSKLKDKLPASPAQLLVVNCWCFTLNEPAGLEVSEIELLPPPASHTPHPE